MKTITIDIDPADYEELNGAWEITPIGDPYWDNTGVIKIELECTYEEDYE